MAYPPGANGIPKLRVSQEKESSVPVHHRLEQTFHTLELVKEATV